MCECQINSGDILVLYTIGVTESSQAADEEFGELRLVDALLRHGESTAAEMAKNQSSKKSSPSVPASSLTASR